ncbi:MAG TPA: alkylhydroperoxidase [Pseudomonas sp.]|uniref:peroxidase-related enzyme n=1 Tax=Stutzerimonas xanthomarina TaxID=271420 RepID=UPI000E8CF51C|nr:peroxidase-related enzyme [Stutzerimonas xanthomarina]MBK3848837.1 peroxidase-related enzyme [Stutzerimonas xanthomarina]MBU1460421.1 peroxidase-related enzyme [Gammaproteobacteria bacterium]MBU2374237.1 peroxidase-related enzyme [Gammaproteobacteria bacterium]HAQ86571.1 alkylhydroperoxidase [Pseudomonas sp.]|tara:strand:+ start:661 stop:1254 length:594 start_codon:yes stop_codon:yes gene_type:complete
MTQAISRFPMVDDLDALPADIRERIVAVQEKAGFVPNVFLMLAHRPDEFRAFFNYHDALMEREGDSLTKAEKEMIVVAVSADHGCLYCVVAHGAILRILAKDPLLADQISVNYRTATISERQQAMLDFALHLAAERGVLDDAWQARLEKMGFTLNDIWDIGAIAALFGLSNRLVSMARTPPNDEFYLLGRVPKAVAN